MSLVYCEGLRLEISIGGWHGFQLYNIKDGIRAEREDVLNLKTQHPAPPLPWPLLFLLWLTDQSTADSNLRFEPQVLVT